MSADDHEALARPFLLITLAWQDKHSPPFRLSLRECQELRGRICEADPDALPNIVLEIDNAAQTRDVIIPNAESEAAMVVALDRDPPVAGTLAQLREALHARRFL